MTIGAAIGRGIGRAIGRTIGSSGDGVLINFAAGEFPSFLTFTRASKAGYWNSAGVYTEAAVNEARIDHNPSTLAARGLLIEGARTNLQPYSADTTNTATGWDVNFTTQVANFGIAPDGTQTSVQQTETGLTTSTTNTLTLVTIPSGSPVTISSFLKAGTVGGWFRFIGASTAGLTNGVSAFFDIASNAIGNLSARGTGTSLSSSLLSIGGGWYRPTVTYTVASVTTAKLYLNTAQSDGSGNRDIDETYEIWGSQIEAGGFASSYIPTVDAAVSRSADSCQTTDLAALGFNAAEGAIVVEFEFEGILGNQWVIQFDGGSSANRMALRSSGTSLGITGSTGGVTDLNITLATPPVARTRYKVAFAYKNNDFAASLNGAAVVTDTSAQVPPVTTFRVGSSIGSAEGFVWIKSIALYPTRLPNTALQELSA
jgi:hypothetical protein